MIFIWLACTDKTMDTSPSLIDIAVEDSAAELYDTPEPIDAEEPAVFTKNNSELAVAFVDTLRAAGYDIPS